MKMMSQRIGLWPEEKQEKSLSEVWHTRHLGARNPFGSRRPTWRRDYELVGVVHSECLETVFLLTQDGWEDPRAKFIAASCPRSTSAGDVIVIPDGRAYRCESSGWTEVKQPSLANWVGTGDEES